MRTSLFISSTYYFQEVPGLREDTYELCYNAACLSLGQNDVETAQQKLKKAGGICWFSFFDTWSWFPHGLCDGKDHLVNV